jgi:pimeloyl-ACP methyl ester carboxylesterase
MMVRVPDIPIRGRAFRGEWEAAVELVPFESASLKENPWGDPTRREIAVLRPPSGITEGRPLILQLPGFAGSGWQEAQRPIFLGESVFGRIFELMRTKAIPEAVVVAPDALTRLGGSQYVNSAATGRYADFVARDLVTWAGRKYGTGPVGVLGQSSGGFGALHLAMEYPGTFAAVGSSAGDMGFDSLFRGDLNRAARHLRAAGGPERFLEHAFEQPGLIRVPTEPPASTLLILAMAACYSPLPACPGEFELPFDIESGALIEDVWKRWLAYDPLLRLEDAPHRNALRRLRSLHLTASTNDEWYLDLAARQFVRRGRKLGLDIAYDEFEGGHFDKVPRFETMYRRMLAALTAG